MKRFKTISESEIQKAAQRLKVSPAVLKKEMDEGDSILDNKEALDSYLKAMGQTLADFEKECFENVVDRIRIMSEPAEELPGNLQDKWSQPVG